MSPSTSSDVEKCQDINEGKDKAKAVTAEMPSAAKDHFYQDQTLSSESEKEEPDIISESRTKNPVEAELVIENGSSGTASGNKIYEAKTFGNAVILNRRRLIITILAVLVVFGVIIGGVCGSGKCKGTISPPNPPRCENERPVSVFNTTTSRYQRLLRIFGDIYDNETFLGEDEGNPRFRALHWVTNEDRLPLGFDSSNYQLIRQRYVLVVFYFSTKGWCWDRKTNWLTGSDDCHWDSITCVDGTKLVEDIRAPGNNMDGTLPSELGDLSQLKSLDLGTCVRLTVSCDLGFVQWFPLTHLTCNQCCCR